MQLLLTTERGETGPTARIEVPQWDWTEGGYTRLADASASYIRALRPEPRPTALLASEPQPRSHVRRKHGYRRLYLEHADAELTSCLDGSDHFVTQGDNDVYFAVLRGDASSAEQVARLALSAPAHLLLVNGPSIPWERLVESVLKLYSGRGGRSTAFDPSRVIAGTGVTLAATMALPAMHIAIEAPRFERMHRRLLACRE